MMARLPSFRLITVGKPADYYGRSQGGGSAMGFPIPIGPYFILVASIGFKTMFVPLTDSNRHV